MNRVNVDVPAHQSSRIGTFKFVFSKRIVISNTRLCQAMKRTENDRFSHDGACYIVSFVVVFPVYMTM